VFCRKAVSLIEMILAIAILGLVAALTLPRFSTAAEAPNGGALLHERLKILRVAIERFHEDHGLYPGRELSNSAADCSAATLVAQLTQFTNEQGGSSPVRAGGHAFGPYLRDGIPACPVPPQAGLNGVQIVATGNALSYSPAARAAGWLYNCETGHIEPNSDAMDPGGRAYMSY
jgi:prepilin-type N-terminal cleavage/methylation domain-containing protein